MTRFDRGGSFGPETACLGPTSINGLISFLGKLFLGKLPGQRRTTREADLSTQQTGAQAPSRLPRPPRDDRWPQGSRRTPRAGPQAFERLSRASRRPYHGSAKAAGGLPRRCQWRADQQRCLRGTKPAPRRWRPDPGRLHRDQEEWNRHRAQSHPAQASRTGEAAGRHIHATAHGLCASRPSCGTEPRLRGHARRSPCSTPSPRPTGADTVESVFKRSGYRFASRKRVKDKT
jgi:hypothetical protein